MADEMTLAEKLVLMKEFGKADSFRFSVTFTQDENRRLEVLSRLVGQKKAVMVSMAAVEFCKELEEELGLRTDRKYHELLWSDKTIDEIISELDPSLIEEEEK